VARHYLDHASTSPLRPEARAAMAELLAREDLGDPGRIHTEGHVARGLLEDARERIAAFFGTRPRSVVLTSGATEAITTAVWGAAERGRHMVVPAIEHSAVRLGAQQHASVTMVGCDRFGRVDPAEVMAAVGPDTAVVQIQWGNHEVGTLQPVAEVVAACRDRGVLVHVDAAAGAGHVPIAFDALGIDLMSVSAHKMGGPAGIGALLVRRGLRLRPLLLGGDQERARRAGMESVLLPVGWAAACDSLANDETEREGAAQAALTTRIVAAITNIDGVHHYGDPSPGGRLPHIACFGIDGVEPQAVLLGLDQAGVAAHSGSACTSEDLQPSPVLQAMGVDAHRSLRLSVGWNTTEADVDAAITAAAAILPKLRALGRR
jgi:cysteine desulfurase